MPVLVLQPGDHRAERVDWVMHRAPVDAGVQVVIGAGHLDLDVGQPTQRIDDGRCVLAQDARIGYHRHIGGQQVRVLTDERLQAGAAGLLLALEDALDVDRRRACRLLERFHCLDVNIQLPLVVRRPPAEDVIADDGGLKRRGIPQFQRIGRLHVVVSVDEECGGLRPGSQPLGVDDRVTRRGHYLRLGEPCQQQFVPQPHRRALDVRLVRRLRADAGDAQELLQFCQKPILICPCVL